MQALGCVSSTNFRKVEKEPIQTLRTGMREERIQESRIEYGLLEFPFWVDVMDRDRQKRNHGRRAPSIVRQAVSGCCGLCIQPDSELILRGLTGRLSHERKGKEPWIEVSVPEQKRKFSSRSLSTNQLRQWVPLDSTLETRAPQPIRDSEAGKCEN